MKSMFKVNCFVIVLVCYTVFAQNTYFLQDTTTENNFVIMEAENYTSSNTNSNLYWHFDDVYDNYSGDDGYIYSPQGTGSGSMDDSAYVGYHVMFLRTGAHYLWFRARPEYHDQSGPYNQDSAYLLFDDVQVVNPINPHGSGRIAMNQLQPGYSWAGMYTPDYDVNYLWGWGGAAGRQDDSERPPIYFDVPTTGVHELKLKPREDGCMIDKIVIVTDSNYVPGDSTLFQNNECDLDLGPEESQVVGIEQISPISGPRSFTLNQNYPNPFNPNTEISFHLQKAGHIDLSIYNLMGRKIVTLADGHHTAGPYQVTWNARDNAGNKVSSGVYFYALTAEQQTQIRKMMLMQ